MKNDDDKKKKIEEWGGGSYAGAPSFQGYAYGYGGPKQLASPQPERTKDFEEIINDLVQSELEEILEMFSRDPSDQFYRDLPGTQGGPAVLAAKKQFVPIDPQEKDNVDSLGPTVDGTPLNQLGNNTANNWKATTPDKLGVNNIQINSLVKNQEVDNIQEIGAFSSFGQGKIAAQRDWQQELEDDKNGDITAKLPLGGFGNISHPKTFGPRSAQKIQGFKETKKSTLIIPEERKKMITEFLETFITEVVCSELEEAEVKQFGSDELMSQITQNLVGVVNKYGGDYDKAYASPEWKKATKDAEDLISKEKVAGILPKQREVTKPFETKPELQRVSRTDIPVKNRIKGMVSTDPAMPAASTTPTGPTPTKTLAAQQTDKKAQLQKKIENLRQKMQTKKPGMQEGKQMVDKMTKLEETIRNFAKKSILNEMQKVSKIFSGLKENASELPVDGDYAVDPSTGEEYFYSESEKAWLTKSELDKIASYKDEEDSFLDSEEGDLSISPDEDPESKMKPQDKQAMIDSLLSMEFDENKKVDAKLLEFYVQKAVKKHFYGE